jgi:hypothetical protein
VVAIMARTAIGIGDDPLLRFHGALRRVEECGEREAIAARSM